MLYFVDFRHVGNNGETQRRGFGIMLAKGLWVFYKGFSWNHLQWGHSNVSDGMSAAKGRRFK